MKTKLVSIASFAVVAALLLLAVAVLTIPDPSVSAQGEVTPTPAPAQDAQATEAVQPQGEGQAGGTGTQGGQAAPGAALDVTLEEVTADPSSYYGQTITLSGQVEELINVRAFVLGEAAALDDDKVLVINSSGQPFDLELTRGVGVRATGVVRPFTRGGALVGAAGQATQAVTEQATAEVTEEPAQGQGQAGTQIAGMLDLNERALNGYEDFTILEVTAIEDIVYAETLGNVAANPENFYGRRLSIEGAIGRRVSDTAFTLSDGGALGARELLILGAGGMTLDPNLAEGQRVRVFGTVRPFVIPDLEAELGTDIDETVFGEFQDYTALTAESVTPLLDENNP